MGGLWRWKRCLNNFYDLKNLPFLLFRKILESRMFSGKKFVWNPPSLFVFLLVRIYFLIMPVLIVDPRYFFFHSVTEKIPG